MEKTADISKMLKRPFWNKTSERYGNVWVSPQTVCSWEKSGQNSMWLLQKWCLISICVCGWPIKKWNGYCQAYICFWVAHLAKKNQYFGVTHGVLTNLINFLFHLIHACWLLIWCRFPDSGGFFWRQAIWISFS